MQCCCCVRGGGGGGGASLGATLLEVVLEAAGDGLQVAHATSASGGSPLCLGAPAEAADLGGRVATRCARLLLDVEGALATTHADAVTLVPSSTECLSSLSHGW